MAYGEINHNQSQQPVMDMDAAAIDLARILARSMARSHNDAENAKREAAECE